MHREEKIFLVCFVTTILIAVVCFFFIGDPAISEGPDVEFYEGQLRGTDRPTHVFIDNQWRELSYPNNQFIGAISTSESNGTG